jgi:hypothetical protein
LNGMLRGKKHKDIYTRAINVAAMESL